ncbi:protein disulfide-isomerase A6 homolog [Onthophagus taurus]|uniref:protein disulfide-isomerase A6 homolog n=1 Tax=Onthophagus taurus TaxID=166361 RepID=UPI0039BE30F6
MYSIIFPLFFISSVNSLYNFPEDVIILSPSNFDKLVLDDNGIWLIEFYAPWCNHCKDLVETWKKVAKSLRGIIKVGALDVEKHTDFGQKYDIRDFPTITIFGLKKKPITYTGARTLQGFVQEALRVLAKNVEKRIERIEGKQKISDVIELTDNNFDSHVLKSNDLWLVEFYAPWCGHCKNLQPEWEKAAKLLKGKVKLGALDCTVNTMKSHEYSISGYPTIKIFPLGDKTNKFPEIYQGPRKVDEIVTFALNLLQDQQPPPEIKELTQESILEECTEKMLCVISVLPHILDCQSSCRNDYIAILKIMGNTFRRNNWGWIWLEAGSQLELEETLGVGGFGYPTLVALNKSKMKYILMKGSFSTNGIKEFLRELSAGKVVSTFSLENGIPKVKEIIGWNGEDGELSVIEEDFDVDVNNNFESEEGKDEL